MNTKIIAIAAVVIIAVVGVGVAFMFMNDDASAEYPVEGNLLVYGNANEDYYIDEDDVELIQKIIDGEVGDAEVSGLADANCDGKIDQADVDFVRKMIAITDKIAAGESYEKMRVYYHYEASGSSHKGSTMFPIDKAVVGGNNTIMTVKLIGGVDKIVAISGHSKADPLDAVLFSDLHVTEISDNTHELNYERISKVATEVGVDAIIMLNNATVTPGLSERYARAGIDLVRISASEGIGSMSAALTAGYLLGIVDSARAYVEFCEDVMDRLQSKLSTVNEEDRVTVLSVVMYNYVSSKTSDMYELTQIAGGKNIADWEGDLYANEGDEWILNYDPDYIIHSRNVGYGNVDSASVMEQYSVYFKGMDAYKNNKYVIVNGNMPIVMRIAYIAHVFYPELITLSDVNSMHQELIEKFLPNIGEDHPEYDVSTDGTFLIYMS